MTAAIPADFLRAAWAALLLLLLAGPAASEATSAASDPLDQKTIHEKYNDGDFESVITALEDFRKRNLVHSRADSIFIAKHLAVVYSANPLTREKGKYYMYQLLDLLPSAKLVDMYVSDEIDRIFDKVREEFMVRQKAFGVDTAAVNLPPRAATAEAQPQAKPAEKKAAAAPPPPAPEKKTERVGKSPNTKYWVAGGAAVVAAGMATFFILSGGEPEDKVYVVR